VRAPFLSIGELVGIHSALRYAAASLYHSPTFSSLVSAPCPWVQTIHDLNHLTYGSLSQRLYYRRILRPFARRARQVITISEFSRSEIAPWIGVPPESLAIAPNALTIEHDLPVDRLKLLGQIGL